MVALACGSFETAQCGCGGEHLLSEALGFSSDFLPQHFAEGVPSFCFLKPMPAMLSPEEGRRAWAEFEGLQNLVRSMEDKFPVLEKLHNLSKPEKQQKHWEFHESMAAAGKRVGCLAMCLVKGGRRFMQFRGYSNYHTCCTLMECMSLHEAAKKNEDTVNMTKLLTSLISFNHDIYYMEHPTLEDVGEKILDLIPARRVVALEDQDSHAYEGWLDWQEWSWQDWRQDGSWQDWRQDGSWQDWRQDGWQAASGWGQLESFAAAMTTMAEPTIIESVTFQFCEQANDWVRVPNN